MKTIFAPITALGNAGIVVIRVSGPKTREILAKLQIKGQISHQKASLCKIYEPEGSVLDEALITFFQNPNSFTGEDVAEISLHASPFIVNKLLAILGEIDDCRLAEAGEFSKRAFLNNKIDLVQAEAIPDLIAAETKAQHNQALKQLQGQLGGIYESWREKLIAISALIEAAIDFPDDDLPQDIVNRAEEEIVNLKNAIKTHLDDNKIGQKIRDGLNLAIIGAPNVGKSSLINFLANSDVAIVSDVAGTTRDVVETHLTISGAQVKISDTAGIRITEDKIEKAGISRALQKAQEADIKIMLFDVSNPVIEENLIDKNTILVANKIDLSNDGKNISDIQISLKERINCDKLINLISDKVNNLLLAPSEDTVLITKERYRIALKNALENLELFSLDNNIEIAAENLRLAISEIGKITGRVDIENILDAIFSKFCIGK